MALPPLTPEQRAAASEKAARTRRERTEARNAFEAGPTTLSAVLSADQTDDTIGKMKVSALLESLPGVDKIRVRRAMERLASLSPAGSATSAQTSALHSNANSDGILPPDLLDRLDLAAHMPRKARSSPCPHHRRTSLCLHLQLRATPSRSNGGCWPGGYPLTLSTPVRGSRGRRTTWGCRPTWR